MDISLDRVQQQFESLRDTSLPQVRRYFRKRIRGAIRQAKVRASSVRRTLEQVATSVALSAPDVRQQQRCDERVASLPFDENGWGSDFDDCDDDDELDDSRDDVPEKCLTTSLSQLSLGVSSSALSHSLRSLPLSSQHSSIISSSSQTSKPPEAAAPLPESPPTEMDKYSFYLAPNDRREGAYEQMTDNEQYLQLHPVPPNYEYVRYGPEGSVSSSSTSSDHTSSSSCNQPTDDIEALLLKSFSWFHSIERDEAERLLKKMGVDGVYLVRPSRRAGAHSPYTLSLFFNGRIFHLNIRKRPDGQFALGMEKAHEKTFRSVVELVEHHNAEAIFLTSKGRPAGRTRLLYTPS